MDVFGHPRAVQFIKESSIAGKFYSFVNAEGLFTIFIKFGYQFTPNEGIIHTIN